MSHDHIMHLQLVNIQFLWGKVFINRCSSEAISIGKDFVMPKKSRTKAMCWSGMVIICFGKCALLIVRKLSFILVQKSQFFQVIFFFLPHVFISLSCTLTPFRSLSQQHYINLSAIMIRFHLSVILVQFTQGEGGNRCCFISC